MKIAAISKKTQSPESAEPCARHFMYLQVNKATQMVVTISEEDFEAVLVKCRDQVKKQSVVEVAGLKIEKFEFSVD